MVHPILKQRERLGLYLTAALLVGGLMTFALSAPDLTDWKSAALTTVPLALLYSFVCLAAWYPCRANPLPGTAPTRALGVHLASAALSSGLWLAIGLAWAGMLDRFGGRIGTERFFLDRAALFFVAGVLLYLLAAAMHYLLLAFEASRRAESRALELRLLAREAELEAFKTQIDPHFIFNCLNSVSSLCGTDPAAARRTAIRLGDFLRASLKLSASDMIPLQAELQLAQAYLDVERVRYGDRLAYEQAVSSECRAIVVPALLLQPLLENALKHGIAHLVDGGTLRIEGEVHAGRMSLRVINPCERDRSKGQGAGIGLANVRGRIRLLYDGRATIAETDLGDRFQVEIVVPADRGATVEVAAGIKGSA